MRGRVRSFSPYLQRRATGRLRETCEGCLLLALLIWSDLAHWSLGDGAGGSKADSLALLSRGLGLGRGFGLHGGWAHGGSGLSHLDVVRLLLGDEGINGGVDEVTCGASVRRRASSLGGLGPLGRLGRRLTDRLGRRLAGRCLSGGGLGKLGRGLGRGPGVNLRLGSLGRHKGVDNIADEGTCSLGMRGGPSDGGLGPLGGLDSRLRR